MTEVGRQPWVVYGYLLTKDAVTPSAGVPVTLAVVLVLYAVLTAVVIGVPWMMGRRWRREDPGHERPGHHPWPASGDGPERTTGSRDDGRRHPSWEAVTVGVALVATMAAYALFAGADFGGGIWDLLAGSSPPGQRARRCHRRLRHPGVGRQPGMDRPRPRPALDWVPDCVRRHHRSPCSSRWPPRRWASCCAGSASPSVTKPSIPGSKRLTGALFACSSLLAPFFLGTAVGAVTTGRIPVPSRGLSTAAWTTPTALVTGALFVAACAFIGAVYLVGDAQRRGHRDLVPYFGHRATWAAP